MKVYLIGAGPGDEGLLTIKGKKILQIADVIIYDYLANANFLRYAKSDAEIIYAGKQADSHTLTQEQINLLIIKKAKENKIVARLKGGDPYLFGRGAEEAEKLVDAKIPFEVIPGISSALAATAYAGIALTHRDYASSVVFATGHESEKSAKALNYKALANSASTLVFFMGMQNLNSICKKLIEAGLAASTPAALIHWGTTPEHRTLISSLKYLAQDAETKNFTAPSLIIVGQVVKLHEKLNWFEQKPLLGKNIIVTRAGAQHSDLTELLADQGANVIQFPTIKISPLENYTEVRKTLSFLNIYDWLIFTSANAIKFFWQELYSVGLDSRALASCKIAAIGPATAQSLKEKGLIPDFIPEKFVAESVVKGLVTLGIKNKQILIPRAKEGRDVLQEQLTKAGASVSMLPIYKTEPSEQNKDLVLELLAKNKIDCITFTSSSTVDNFMKLIPPATLKAQNSISYACIGPITSTTLEKYGLNCDYKPDSYTTLEMAKLLIRKI